MDADGRRLIVTDFDVVAVELSGTATWVGIDARLALGATPSGLPGVSQPGRCCGPTTICIPVGPAPDPDPIFRYSLAERMAVVRAPEQQPFGPSPVDAVSEARDVPAGGGHAVNETHALPPMSRVGDYRTRQDEGRSPVRALCSALIRSGTKPRSRVCDGPTEYPVQRYSTACRSSTKGAPRVHQSATRE